MTEGLTFDSVPAVYPVFGGRLTFQRVRRFLAFVLVLMSGLVMASWIFGFEGLMSFALPGMPPTMPIRFNAALSFFCTGIALYLIERDTEEEYQTNFSRNAIAGLILLVPLALGIVTVAEHISGRSFGIDGFFVNLAQIDFEAAEASMAGRMRFNAALCFVMSSLAILNIAWGRWLAPSLISRFLIGAVALISFFSLLGYAYDPFEMNRLLFEPISGAMTLGAAILFLVLSITVLMSVGEQGPIHLLASRSPGGFVARRLTLMIVITALLLGWASVRAYQMGLASADGAILLFASANAMLALVWINGVGRELNGVDARRLDSEKFLREIVNTAPAMIFLRNLDGQVLLSNPEFDRMKARCPFAVENEAFVAAERHVVSMHERVTREQECVVDGQKRTYLASHFPLFNQGERLVAIGLFASDITDRKEIELALRRSEEAYRTLADAIPVIVWTVDSTGHATYFNSRWFEYTGLDFDRSKGLGWTQAVHPADVNASIEAFRSGMETRQPIEFEHRMQRNDGSYRWHLVRAIPVLENGQVSRWFGTSIDIEDQKRASDLLERRVAERTKALTNANRELEAFSYSVSHDLRAPLRSMDGFSRLLLEKYADQIDDQGRDYLSRVRSASRNMAGLIEDLLTLSRLGRTEMVFEPVDLSRLAEEIIDEKKRAEPWRDVEVRIEKDLHDFGDASMLRIALYNLLDNAWKYTSKKPKAVIEFFARRDDQSPESRPVYVVRDDGVGFDMAQAGQLFKAFQRLHRADEFQGTGIGLVTAQRILERHGGNIWAEGKLGKGASFYFTIGRVQGAGGPGDEEGGGKT